MTLADLAALAAKVEGFVRPPVGCSGCDGSGGVFVWYGETRETAYGSRCEQCGNTGCAFDNSPAALAMAVLSLAVAKDMTVEMDGGAVLVRFWVGDEAHSGMESAADESPESIARALLTALLRAHGVEVADA